MIELMSMIILSPGFFATWFLESFGMLVCLTFALAQCAHGFSYLFLENH